MSWQRFRSHEVQSRVRCTYKKPLSPEQQSVEQGQHLESSVTEVTVHVSLLRTEAGLDTYETIGDQQGPTYANVKQINMNCQTHRDESLTHEDGTVKQTQSEDEHCLPSETSLPDAKNKLDAHGVADVKTAEKQENKDHVYAIVHKANQGRDSGASVHTKTPCSKRLEPASPACSAVTPVNRSSAADPADHLDARRSSVELVNHSQEALVGDEKKDYLYAVVDKANRKKRPPQVNTTGMHFCWVVCAFSCCFFLNFFWQYRSKIFCSLLFHVVEKQSKISGRLFK